MKKLICMFMALSLMITAGCATTGKKGQATAEGAGVGALVGAIVGQIAGGDTESTLIGAGIGGALGALVGYGYATKLENEKEKLKGKERNLDARIEYAEAVNQETRRYNAQTEKNIKTLEDQVNAAKANKQDLSKYNAKVSKAVNELEQDKKTLSSELAEMKGYRKSLVSQNQPQSKVNKLDAQIRELENQLAVLQKNSRRLASISKKTKV
nr:glycine zipper domain-containing protein [uncultured Desulfobacter sp.]